MRLIPVRCPHCGAAIKLAPAATSVECDYCRTSSIVATASAVQPVGQGAVVVVNPRAPQWHGPSYLALVLGTVAAMALIGVGIGGYVQQGSLAYLIGCSIFGLGVWAAIAWQKGVAVILKARAEERFRERAVAMRAVIESMRDAGGGGRSLDLAMLVTRPDGTRYRVERREQVPLVLVSRLTGETVLPLLVDPEDGARVEVLWHLVPGGGSGRLSPVESRRGY